jgi:uncharacterized membrane protein YkvI
VSGVFHMRNVTILLGVVITAVAVLYLATEFLERISQWGRVLSLVLLTVMLTSLGRHFEGAGEENELVDRSGWRWLRVTTAFYALGILSALTAVVVFLGIDDLDPVIKALVALAIGVGLILAAARKFGPRK